MIVFNQFERPDTVDLTCLDKSRTIQSQAKEADINTIVKNFGVTGQLPLISMPPLNDDFDGATDYRTLLELKMAADKSFFSLPAETRARFHNDPVLFVDYCSNEANKASLAGLGLLTPEAEAKLKASETVPV